MRSMIALAFVYLLACVPSPDLPCEALARTPLGFDEPGPSGQTPREALQHTSGRWSGTLAWASGESTAITLITTLDERSAAALEHAPPDDEDRRVCPDALVIEAKVEITMDNDALMERLTVELVALEGALVGMVEARAELSTLAPMTTLIVSWPNDAGPLRGQLVANDTIRASFEASLTPEGG